MARSFLEAGKKPLMTSQSSCKEIVKSLPRTGHWSIERIPGHGFDKKDRRSHFTDHQENKTFEVESRAIQLKTDRST